MTDFEFALTTLHRLRAVSTRALLALMPANTPRDMSYAWVAALTDVIKAPDLMAAFRHETGNTWEPDLTNPAPAITPLTDAEWEFFKALAQWVNVNVWGPMDGETKDA